MMKNEEGCFFVQMTSIDTGNAFIAPIKALKDSETINFYLYNIDSIDISEENIKCVYKVSSSMSIYQDFSEDDMKDVITDFIYNYNYIEFKDTGDKYLEVEHVPYEMVRVFDRI